METTNKIDPLHRDHARAGGHVSLLFSWGEHTQVFALREGQEVVVGRASPAKLILDDHSLSRTHARLSLRGGRVILEDLGSTNGCLLNGANVPTAVLGEEDLVRLGAVELRVCAPPPLPTRQDEVSHAAFMRMLSDELTRARVFGRTVSLIAVRHALASPENEQKVLRAIGRALNPVDRRCNFAPTLSLVLLPERDGAAARSWLEDLSRSAGSGFQASVASYPSLTCTAEELVSRALDGCYGTTVGTLNEVTQAPVSVAGPILRSAAMRRLYELIARAARTPLPVLVQGETGSGKELVARALHEKSPRSRAPFIALNCATIPASLLESVLFGHERGAFTGAARQAEGIFEQAHGGTVFLDEIGELSAQAQAALLRVLELQRVVRVGGTKEIEVDTRVVAATHRHLPAMVEAGAFREDLLFRLDALTLTVPPLRERKEEILPLAELFLARARTQWGASAERLSDDACDALIDYGWPGNVRQLKNAVERAATICTGDVIDLTDLPEQLWRESSVASPALTASTAAGEARTLPERVREFEIGIIRGAMQQAGGNQAQAARILGVPRRTLANKLLALGIREEC